MTVIISMEMGIHISRNVPGRSLIRYKWNFLTCSHGHNTAVSSVHTFVGGGVTSNYI